ncbi:MAG: hypothetical protein E7295_05315 [Lachnospiraceae bacterium]|jgi:hypothetical protein|nr:hypothetical protein [Lachnospiraceae bacterium]
MRFLEALKFWDKKEQITGFAAIDSLGKAHMMMDKGMLEPLYLKALRFGGTETPDNRVYVPVGIGRIKEKHDQTIEELMKEQSDLVYSCLPKYKGMSRIPYEIVVSATKPEPDKEVLYSETISIW